MPVIQTNLTAINEKSIYVAPKQQQSQADYRKLQQIIPSRCVDGQETFHYSNFCGRLLVSYITDDCVILMSDEFAVLHTIDCSPYMEQNSEHKHKKGLVCICLGSDGVIMVGCGKKVLIFRPSTTDGAKLDHSLDWNNLKWEISGVILQDFNVNALSINKGAKKILVCGSRLVLWNFQPKVEDKGKIRSAFDEQEEDPTAGEEKRWFKIWESDTPTEVFMSSVSLDMRYFCTAGSHDKLPKLWYRCISDENPEKIEYAFAYLPHPRSVTRMQWRTGRRNPRTMQNVLLTSCRDYIARLWMETGNGHFATCAVINGGPNHEYSWLHYESYLRRNNDNVGEEAEEEESSENFKMLERDRFSSVSLKCSLSEEWIVEVKNDNVVAFWQLTGLVDSVVRALPEVTLWLQTKVELKNKLEYTSRLVAMCTQVTDDERETPEKIKLYLVNRSGALCHWNFHIEETPASRIATSTSLRCFGHNSPIKRIKSNSTSMTSFVGSLDAENNLIGWFDDSTELVDPFPLLRDVGIFQATKSFSFSECGTKLIVINNTEVNVYEFSLAREHATTTFNYRMQFPPSFKDMEFEEVSFLKIPTSAITEPLYISMYSNSQHIKKLCVWTMEFRAGATRNILTPITIVEQDVLSEQYMAELSAFAVCHHCSKEVQLDTYTLITGHMDGTLAFWDWDEAQKLQLKFKLQAHDAAINSISIAYFGRICSVAGSTARIWELESAGDNFFLETEIRASNNSSIFVDWLRLTNGSHLLGVGYDKKIYIYIPSRSPQMFDFGVHWKPYLVANNLPYDVTAVSFTSNLNLVVSAGPFLTVLSRWGPVLKTLNAQSFNYIQDALDRQSMIPFYHPKVLVQDLLAGNTVRVEHILVKLEKLLKRYEEKAAHEKDANSVAVLLQIPLIELLETPAVESISAAPSSEKLEEASEIKVYDGTVAVDAVAMEHSSGFNASRAESLASLLAHVSLPGLSRSDQVVLLAVVDTVKDLVQTRGGLDDCALRFLLSQRIFRFSSRESLPTSPTKEHVVSTANSAWAMHSESQEALLNTCLGSGSINDMTWADFHSLGVGLWLRNIPILKKICEGIAKAQFSLKKDPSDCALFYVAMGKKTTLIQLYKAVKDIRISEFLQKDFTQDSAKQAAAKNAYALLSKQRFEYSAAFFLLAGDLKSATSILLKHTGDYQLPLVIARLAEDGEDGPIFKDILTSHVIPLAKQKADMWLESTALWILRRYPDALSALARGNLCEGTWKEQAFNPGVVHLFNFLRSRPFLRANEPSEEQEKLLRRAIYAYTMSGCSILAIEQLQEQKKVNEALSKKRKEAAVAEEEEEDDPFGGFGGLVTIEEEPTEDEDPGGSKNKEASDLVLCKEERLARQSIQSIQNILGIQIFMPRLKVNYFKSRDSLLSDIDVLKHHSLQINLSTTIFSILRVCDENQYISQKLMLGSNEDESVLFLKETVELMYNIVCDISLMARPMSIEQARSIAKRINEIHRGYIELSRNVQFSEAVCKETVICLKLGILISAWVTRNYKSVLAVLNDVCILPFSPEMQSVVNEMENAPYNKPKQGGADKPANNFMMSLLHYLLSLSCKQLANNSALAIKWNGSINSWVSSIENQMKRTPLLIDCDRETSLRILTQANVSLILRELLRYSAIPDDDDLLHLWEFLQSSHSAFLNDKRFAHHLARHVPVNSGGEVEFQSQPVRIYKDKDILHSFCVHPEEKSHFVVASSKSLIEFDANRQGAGGGGAGFGTMSGSSSALSAQQNKPKGKRVVAEAENSGVSMQAEGRGSQRLGTLSGSFSKSFTPPPRFPPPTPPRVGSNSAVVHSPTSQSSAALTSAVSTPDFNWRRPTFTMLSRKNEDDIPDHRSMQAVWLESHPLQPYYISASAEGAVNLWIFHHKESIFTYRPSGSSRVSKVHFNRFGTKFGYCDQAGYLCLWRFNPYTPSQKPFLTVNCHDKGAFDFCFLNAGSFVATGGQSSDHRNVKLWDTISPPHKSNVRSFLCHLEDRSSSLVYSPKHGLIISGGKKGEIVVMDLRGADAPIHSLQAHNGHVKSLTIDLEERFVVSGSSDGNIKAWELPSMKLMQTWQDQHEKQTFVKVFDSHAAGSPVFTYGVMRVSIQDEMIYSCGSDGRLLYRKFK